ncbi:MAG: hypothetical protein KDH96_12565 [Candidatus Riesia sp.]|nr:hypothetical protein [Candidatus Riesia sp.]
MKILTPDSKMFWIIMTLNILLIVINFSEGDTSKAIWIISASLWMWMYFIHKEEASFLKDALKHQEEINNHNMGELDRLLKMIQLKGIPDKVSMRFEDGNKKDKLPN